MARQREILFEGLSPADYPALLWFCLRGERVAVFDFSCDLKKKRLLRYLINRNMLGRIYIRPNTAEHGRAIDLTESICASVPGQHLLREVQKLYAKEEVDAVFKKSLLEDVFRCLYIARYFDSRPHQNGDVLFFGRRFRCSAGLIPDGMAVLPGYVRRAGLERVSAALGDWVDKAMLVCWLSAWLFIYASAALIGSVCGCAARLPRRYQFAFLLHSLFQVESNGARGFDAVLDRECIRTDNSVFILTMPVPERLLAPYRRQGYVFFDMPAHSSPGFCAGRRDAFPTVLKAVRACGVFFSRQPAHRCFVKACCLCLRTFVRWQLAVQDIVFDQLVYTNDESAGQTAANLLLSSRGVRVWNYACFLGGGYLFAVDDDFSPCRNVLWAFLSADRYLGMNADACRYNRLHHQNVKEYIPAGSLYSHGIRELIRPEVRERFLAERFPGRDLCGMKTVAFFDTTFIDDATAMTTFDDCLAFYRDIIALLEHDPNVLALIKPSKNLRRYLDPAAQWSSPRKADGIAVLWRELNGCDRVCWAFAGRDNRSFLDFSMNNLVIAVSDLVVTHCMSSPAAEAWGAGKRAFWYESGNKHCGVRLAAVPGLIVHGKAALFERAADLLYRISDEDHRQFLRRHVQGRVVAETDGQAMRSFRQMLAREGAACGSRG